MHTCVFCTIKQIRQECKPQRHTTPKSTPKQTDTNHKTDRRTDTVNHQNKGAQTYNQKHEEKIPPGSLVFESIKNTSTLKLMWTSTQHRHYQATTKSVGIPP